MAILPIWNNLVRWIRERRQLPAQISPVPGQSMTLEEFKARNPVPPDSPLAGLR
jgi:hypothetical protein